MIDDIAWDQTPDSYNCNWVHFIKDGENYVSQPK